MKTKLLALLLIAASPLLAASEGTPVIQDGSIVGPRALTSMYQTELKDGKLVLCFRRTTTTWWMEGPQTTITVWKEVYGVKDGAIVFEERVDAKYTPETTVSTREPEKVEWPK